MFGIFPILLYIVALLYAYLTWDSINKYRIHHVRLQELVERCVSCNAEVIRPVILNGSYTSEQLRDASLLLSSFQNVYNLPLEYVCTEVRFMVNGIEVQTMILRQNELKQPKVGDSIPIFYDMLNPQQAFAENMKSIILHKPLRDCVMHGIITVICLLSGIFMQLV